MLIVVVILKLKYGSTSQSVFFSVLFNIHFRINYTDANIYKYSITVSFFVCVAWHLVNLDCYNFTWFESRSDF